MKKITFIGAGSVQFTTAVVKDITTYPALDTAEICLMDIDENGYVYNHQIAETVINVDRRMSYTNVKKILLKEEDAVIIDSNLNEELIEKVKPYIKEYMKPILNDFYELNNLFKKRKEKRFRYNFHLFF